MYYHYRGCKIIAPLGVDGLFFLGFRHAARKTQHVRTSPGKKELFCEPVVKKVNTSTAGALVGDSFYVCSQYNPATGVVWLVYSPGSYIAGVPVLVEVSLAGNKS